MSVRSAPFNPSSVGFSDNANKSIKKQHRALFSDLLSDIKEFRESRFPPAFLEQVKDMPIYQGNIDTVRAYSSDWKPLIDRAKSFYPSAGMPPKNLPLPASLGIPQFIYNVEKVNLTKTQAKESKSFGSVGALVDKCGDFSDEDVQRMNKEISDSIGLNFKLVAHREFIDLRAYVFCVDNHGQRMPPQRIRFYRTGLILQVTKDFSIVDSRNVPRKRRNDAYTDPVADNGLWRVFFKIT